MSRNLTGFPASVFALRAFAVINALTLSGALYTGHDALWALSILLSLTILSRHQHNDDGITRHHPKAFPGQSPERRQMPICPN